MADPTPPTEPTPSDPLAQPAAQPPPQSAPPPATPPDGPPAAAAPPGPRRRRRWPFVVGGVVLLLALLVVLLPTIAGIGWVRSIVLAQVNKGLNGRVQVEDWSVGWTGGISVRGVRVFDEAGIQVLELPSFTTQLSLLDAIQGRYAFGKTVVRGLNFNVRQYADGTDSLSRLVKDTGPKEKKSSPLPFISGDFSLVDCRGTLDLDAPPGGKSHSINFSSINGNARVTDINQPIPNDLKVSAIVDRRQPGGTLDVAGAIGVIRDNRVNLDAARGDETIKLAGLDLATLLAFLGPQTGVNELRGVTDATVAVQLPAPGKAVVSVQTNVKNPLAAGPAFAAGEKFQAANLALNLPTTTIDMSAGQDRWELWPIVVGDGSASQPLALTVTDSAGAKLIDFTLSGRTNVGAVLNQAKNLKPGSDGAVALGLHADVGKLGLSKTLSRAGDLQLTSGVLDVRLDTSFKAGQTDLKSLAVDLTNVAGRNTAENRDVTLQPIHLAARGTSFGGGLSVPDVRDVSLDLTARGTSVKLQAPTLTNPQGTVRVVLDELQQDLQQLGFLRDIQLRGEVAAQLTAQGDLLTTQPSAGQSNVLAATLTARGLEVRRPGEPPLAQQYVRIEARGQVVGDPKDPQAIQNATLVARTGDEQNPLVAADVSADAIRFVPREVTDPKSGQRQTVKAVDIPKFSINPVAVTDLSRAQRELGPLAAALGDLRFEKGSLAVTGTGGYDGKTVRLDGLQTRLNGVTLARDYAPTAAGAQAAAASPATRPVRVEVVSDYSLGVDLAGKVTSDAAGSQIVLSQLGLSDNKNWLTVAKAGAGDVVLTSPAGAGPAQVRGGISVGVALVPVNILRSLGDNPVQVAVQTPPGAESPTELRDGRIDGVFQFTPGADGQSFGIAADVNASRVTLVRADRPAPLLNNEAVKVALRGQVRGDFSSLSGGQLDVTGSVGEVHASQAVLAFKVGAGKDARPATPLEMVRQLKAQGTVDGAKVQSLLDAFAPPKPAATASAAAAAELPPRPLPVQLASSAFPVVLAAAEPPPAMPEGPPAGGWQIVDYRVVPDAVRNTLQQGLPGGRKVGVNWYRQAQNGQYRYTARYNFLNHAERFEVVIDPGGKVVTGPRPLSAVPAPAAPAAAANVEARPAAPVPAAAPIPGSAPRPNLVDVAPPPNVISRPPQPQPASGQVPAAPAPTPPAGSEPPPVPPGPKPPPPPARIASGTASFTLDVNRENDGRLKIAPSLNARGVALAVGSLRHEVGDVTLKTQVVIAPAPPVPAAPSGQSHGGEADPSLLDQVRELQVPELTASGEGVTIQLKEPIVLQDPARFLRSLSAASAPTTGPARPEANPASPIVVRAAITASGDVARLMALSDALNGEPPKPSYAGRFELNQRISSAGGVVRAEGDAAIRDFVVKDEKGADAFRESLVRLVNNIATDRGHPEVTATAIDQLLLTMESSKAVSADLKGRIAEAGNVQDVNLAAKLTYNAAQLWTILRPMFRPSPDPITGKTPEDRLRDSQLAGQYTKDFTIKARYPATATAAERLRYVEANGSLTLDLIDAPAMGVRVEKLELPVSIKDGVIHMADLTKPAGQQAPPPAVVNGGQGRLNLGNAEGTLALDMTGDHPRLSGPANLKLLENVNANKVFANFLGDFVNNPLLLKPQEAAGAVNLTVEELNRLPIDSRLTAYDPRNDGRVSMNVSISRVQLGNEFIMRVQQGLQALNILGESVNLLDYLRGDIKNYKITVEHGVVSQDMKLDITNQSFPLRLYGNVRLADKTLMPLTIQLPPQLFKGQVGQYLSNGLELPLTGHVSAPQFDLGAALQKNLLGRFTGGGNAGNPQDLVNSILQGLGNGGLPIPGQQPGQQGQRPGQGPQSRPAQPDPVDLIEGLLNRGDKSKDGKDGRKEPDRRNR